MTHLLLLLFLYLNKSSNQDHNFPWKLLATSIPIEFYCMTPYKLRTQFTRIFCCCSYFYNPQSWFFYQNLCLQNLSQHLQEFQHYTLQIQLISMYCLQATHLSESWVKFLSAGVLVWLVYSYETKSLASTWILSKWIAVSKSDQIKIKQEQTNHHLQDNPTHVNTPQEPAVHEHITSRKQPKSIVL